MSAEDFLGLTLDVWEVPPESARRVGHPAPFPVELPERLIRLYTFAGDLVLDPFMGSGSALVAAARLRRRYIGYDLDADYVAIAAERVANAGAAPPASATGPVDGGAARSVAERALADAGFAIVARNRRLRGTGVTVDVVAADGGGGEWFVDVAGPNTAHRGGLQRTDVVWRALGRAAAIRAARGPTPLLLLTTGLPRRPSEGDSALRAAGPDIVTDVVDVTDDCARARLLAYAAGNGAPVAGFWTAADLMRRR